ncbi:peptidoglycan bridge formation glycyltransferase FemA/FemB family protein [Candidatus Peregrinibacteria bacterium]|nr:peptidoglycan bridge formation glycyltransferase FemA/FemB family protein [Candidatus Peregrinibacteria bacterium]
MLNIRITSSKKDYKFGQSLIEPAQRSFLQSHEYGQMQNKLGHEPVYLLVINEKEEIVKSYLVILFKAKRGRYLFCPYGVVNKYELEALLEFLRQLAKQMKVDFLRFSPLIDDNTDNKKMFLQRGFRDAPVHMMHPELLWLLDLNKSEKQLLTEMRKNTRYGIKQAEKLGVKISSGTSLEMLKKFYEIHEITSKRQKFVPFPWSYLQAQLETFAEKDQMKIYLAEHEGKVIAGAVIMFYGDEAEYHHGASLSEYNKISASYLIQWEAIKEAKARGLHTYNFWGVVDNAPKHPWAGLSFFKKGFGGVGKAILHCQDLPLTWKYWFNFLIETVRRIKRGY